MADIKGVDPFHEGWAAGNRHMACSQCPYAPDVEARYEWLDGWSMAGHQLRIEQDERG